MFKRNLSLAALTMCVAVGCGETKTEDLGGKRSGTLSSLDNSYFRDITQGNLTEIESSKKALQYSTNEKVRNFAQHMISDHTSAGSSVQAVASAKGVTLPTMLDEKHQDLIKPLDGKTGPDFDKAYIDLQIAAHEDTINTNTYEADNANDAGVKNLAQSLKPTLEGHLTSAKQIKQSMQGM